MLQPGSTWQAVVLGLLVGTTLGAVAGLLVGRIGPRTDGFGVDAAFEAILTAAIALTLTHARQRRSWRHLLAVTAILVVGLNVTLAVVFAATRDPHGLVAWLVAAVAAGVAAGGTAAGFIRGRSSSSGAGEPGPAE